MTRGVIYLLSGSTYAELLCTSLYTLRQHWTGPVTIFATDEPSTKISERIGHDPQLNADVRPAELAQVRRRQSYCTKPSLPPLSPYDQTVYLDCDTLVVAPIDELFEHPLTLTQFSNWTTTGGRIVSGRLKQWRGLGPATEALVNEALASPQPAVNTGIFGFHRDHPILPAWQTLTLAGARCSFTDELAMQLLAPHADTRILSDEWNLSPLYGKNRDEVRIHHLHGRAHVRKRQGRAIWRPFFDEAREAKAGQMDQWGGTFDKAVKVDQHAAT